MDAMKAISGEIYNLPQLILSSKQNLEVFTPFLITLEM